VYLFRNNDKVSQTISQKYRISESEALNQLSRSSWAIPSETLTTYFLPNSTTTSPRIAPTDPMAVVAIQPLDAKLFQPNNSVAPVDVSNNTSISNIPNDLLISIGLASNVKGKIFVDPTAAAVIVDKQGKTYYVLTKEEAVRTQNKYGVITNDGKRYEATVLSKKISDGLAILTFNSKFIYKIAQVSDLQKLTAPIPLYISGWSKVSGVRQPIVLQGELSDIDSLKIRNVFSYTNKSSSSLGSGIIWTSDGYLLGINDRIYAENSLGQGIPIHQFLNSLKANSTKNNETNINPVPSCSVSLFGDCSP
jgi:S1-C subfamily serine protease